MLTLHLSRAVEQLQGENLWGQEDPDAGLVAAARADPRAFGLLYERYREPIFRYCYNRLRRRKAAQAAALDVFLEAFANLRRYPGGAFAVWLYSIAGHVAADYHRRLKGDRADAECDDVPLAPLEKLAMANKAGMLLGGPLA